MRSYALCSNVQAVKRRRVAQIHSRSHIRRIILQYDSLALSEASTELQQTSLFRNLFHGNKTRVVITELSTLAQSAPFLASS